MHEKNKKIPSGAEECVEAYRAGGEKTDPQGSWTGNPDDCPNPRAVSGGTFLHDAFPFVPGMFAGTELYGAEMMSDPGLLSTGIWSPNEDALLREKDKRSSGGRNAEFTASRPAERNEAGSGRGRPLRRLLLTYCKLYVAIIASAPRSEKLLPRPRLSLPRRSATPSETGSASRFVK